MTHRTGSRAGSSVARAEKPKRPAKASKTRTPEGLVMGGTGALHPPIGLGLWGMGRWDPAEEEHTRTVLDRGLEAGIRWIDTAEVYGAGRSERLVGDAIARIPAGAPVPFVSTKLSWEHLRASQIRASLLGSLRRLGVPKADLYLVHAPDPHVPIVETMGTLEGLWKAGLIGALGVSNFSLEELEAAEAALSEAELVVNQVRFNLFEREDADPLVEYCRRKRIVLEAYSPTARGLLAGRFLTGRAPPHRDARGGRGVFAPEVFPEFQVRARRLKTLAEEAGVPMLSLAFHALARQGAAPVFGASRPDQVDSALAAWALAPAADVLDRAERIGRGDAD
jgi:aryl-alcohol dehydrogenase-like predicted oxidoreductase